MSKKKSYTVDIQMRDGLGTAESRRMRHAGIIPAVIYGLGKPATSISVEVLAAGGLLRQGGLMALKGSEKENWNTVVKEVQRHPVSGAILHIDFLEVNLDEVISAHARIEPHGEPAGEAHGGQLEHLLHEVEIRCKPADMIDVLIVEVSHMELDTSLHVSDLEFPEGVEAATDGDIAVFQVRLPRVEAEPEEEEGIEGVEGEEGEEGETAENAEDGEGEKEK
ncbi:MAG: 50S ribosomal protein L25 [Lentisphaeria bacterium]|nr:50S ribosomal protein L25 [Lentisphaeria bacterium]